jgi:predicted ester cyclase
MADPIEAAQRHDEAFNAQDPQARMAAETTDIESVLPGGITLRGPEQVVGFLQIFWEALPDARITHVNHVASGDAIAVEGTLTGTHTGTLRFPQGDIPATGNRIELRYASVKRIREGKVASEHLYFDQLDFLQQLGALPRDPGVGVG